MKLFLYVFFSLMISSCCMNGTKCDPVIEVLQFRIVDAVSGDDLVFGPSRIYHPDSILFFSLNGTDTIKHATWQNTSISGSDSVLSVSAAAIDNTKLFIRLTDSDTDTLQITSSMHDSGECCGMSKTIRSVKYRGKYLDTYLSVLEK